MAAPLFRAARPCVQPKSPHYETQSCTWGGVRADIYHLERGEGIPRHQHPVEHTTMVLAGQSGMQIFDGREPECMTFGFIIG